MRTLGEPKKEIKKNLTMSNGLNLSKFVNRYRDGRETY